MRTPEIWVTFSCPMAGYVGMGEERVPEEKLRVGPFRSLSFDRAGSVYGLPFADRGGHELIPIADISLGSMPGSWSVDSRHAKRQYGSIYRLMQVDAIVLEVSK